MRFSASTGGEFLEVGGHRRELATFGVGDAVLVHRQATDGDEPLVHIQSGAIGVNRCEHRDSSRMESTTPWTGTRASLAGHRGLGESPTRATRRGCNNSGCLSMSRNRLLGRLAAPEKKRSRTSGVVGEYNTAGPTLFHFHLLGCGQSPLWGLLGKETYAVLGELVHAESTVLMDRAIPAVRNNSDNPRKINTDALHERQRFSCSLSASAVVTGIWHAKF
jgi:hypothetical protein